MNVINYAVENYKVKNVYLLGFSQGAVYTYITGIKNQDKIKGIICIGGYIPRTDKSYSLLSDNEINECQDIKIMIAHSMEDKAIKFEYAKKSRKILKKAGYKLEALFKLRKNL